jgi:regulator of protease activity HflC (stomatin/prohibitin superfamily)
MLKLLSLFTLGMVEFVVVRQGEVRIVERRGKFARVAEPGIHMLLPLSGYGDTVGTFKISHFTRDESGRSTVQPRQRVSIISMRMQVDDYPKESVITRDNATVNIDAVVYYRIFDAQKAVYEVQDYVAALQKLVQSALRDECGKFELDQLLVSRDTINQALKLSLDQATDPWGIKVDRVEIKDIDLGEFGAILAEQRAAETKRRTDITEAEGHKRAAILKAEGEKEAAVLKATGYSQSLLLQAEAEKTAAIFKAEADAASLLKIREAEADGYALLAPVFGANHGPALLQVLQIQKAQEISAQMAQGKATKIYLPTDVSGLFGLLEDVARGSATTNAGEARR